MKTADFLRKVDKVFLSCKTQDQLENASNWVMKVKGYYTKTIWESLDITARVNSLKEDMNIILNRNKL